MAVPHLSQALVLEAQVMVADGAGGHEVSWQGLGTLWAEMVAGAGRDPEGEERLLSTVPWRITLRGAPAGAPMRPVAGQRLRMGTRLFAILAVAERDRAGRFLVCHCREEVAP